SPRLPRATSNSNETYSRMARVAAVTAGSASKARPRFVCNTVPVRLKINCSLGIASAASRDRAAAAKWSALNPLPPPFSRAPTRLPPRPPPPPAGGPGPGNAGPGGRWDGGGGPALAARKPGPPGGGAGGGGVFLPGPKPASVAQQEGVETATAVTLLADEEI